MRTITTLAIATTLAAGTALGETQGLTPDDAREFITSLGERAETAVQEGDWQGIARWIGEHVAEDAPIAVRGEFLMSEGPAGNYAMTMKGADLHRFAQMTMALSGRANLAEALSEYRLETDVAGTWQAPDGKVGVAVTFYEVGRFDVGQMHGGAAEDAEAAEATAEFDGIFSSMTECGMRLGGSPDAVVIEMAACEMKLML